MSRTGIARKVMWMLEKFEDFCEGKKLIQRWIFGFYGKGWRISAIKSRSTSFEASIFQPYPRHHIKIGWHTRIMFVSCYQTSLVLKLSCVDASESGICCTHQQNKKWVHQKLLEYHKNCRKLDWFLIQIFVSNNFFFSFLWNNCLCICQVKVNETRQIFFTIYLYSSKKHMQNSPYRDNIMNFYQFYKITQSRQCQYNSCYQSSTISNK